MTSRYEVKKLDTELIKIMSTKVNSATFAAIILVHMEDQTNQDDLEELCSEIGKIQCLTKSTGKSDSSNDASGWRLN